VAFADLLTETLLELVPRSAAGGYAKHGADRFPASYQGRRAVEDAGWDVNLDMPALNQRRHDRPKHPTIIAASRLS